MILDAKNCEQRKQLRDLLEVSDKVQSSESWCKDLEVSLQDKTWKLKDTLFELNTVTAKFESLHSKPNNHNRYPDQQNKPKCSGETTGYHGNNRQYEPISRVRPVPMPRKSLLPKSSSIHKETLRYY